MAIISDNVKLNNFLDKVDTLSDNIIKSPLYIGTTEALTTGLKDFSLTEQEQSMAFADFMAKTYLGQLEIIHRTSLAFDQTVAQTEAIDSEKAIKEAQSAQDLLLKTAQTNLVTEQKNTQAEQTRLVGAQADALPPSEAAKTLKTKREVALVNETTVLTMEQINSERLRQQDTKANISLKNQQIKVTWESAKTEESRRLVLLRANNDNIKIKQNEHLVNYFKVVSDDEDVAITAENLHTTIKTAIEGLDDNAIVIANTIPTGSDYASSTAPTDVSATITSRVVADILEVE